MPTNHFTSAHQTARALRALIPSRRAPREARLSSTSTATEPRASADLVRPLVLLVVVTALGVAVLTIPALHAVAVRFGLPG